MGEQIKQSKPKPKRCPICRELYTPWSFTQKVCRKFECIKKSVATKTGRKKLKKLADKQTKERLKTKSDLLKEAQTAFNAFIRQRDKKQPCISCGTTASEVYDAGHFKTTKAYPALRFNEDNCHRQCRKCNTYLSGNIHEYRKGLILKIGVARLDAIEGNHPALKLTIEDIVSIKEKYKNKLKSLKAAPTYQK